MGANKGQAGVAGTDLPVTDLPDRHCSFVTDGDSSTSALHAIRLIGAGADRIQIEMSAVQNWAFGASRHVPAKRAPGGVEPPHGGTG
jgi:hypothetical protein